MSYIPEDELKDIVIKYESKIRKEMGSELTSEKPVLSREYEQFKKEMLPKNLSIYEKLCTFSENLLKIKPDPKKEADLKEAIEICHLNVTPSGSTSFALLVPFGIILIGMIFSFMVPYVFGNEPSMFFAAFFLMLGMILLKPLGNMPFFLADSWRLKASNQMVLSVFYVVTYMRHTSNLELAINFAADHLSPPLSLDFKKILWDVETQKYESVKESLDNYLQSWKKWNMEFIEAFHLIEGSLYEPSEERRLSILDKSLTVMLEETYEKMLHYAQELKSPITMLHMMGIILPILGLVILPLVVSFMQGIEWYHIAMLYNVSLPLVVYFMGKNILSKRPTGYGDSDISESNPELKKYKNVIIKLGKKEFAIPPLYFSLAIGIVLIIIAISPMIIHAINCNFDAILSIENGKSGFIFDDSSECNGVTRQHAKFYFLGYRMDQAKENEIGPYGLGSSLLSLLLPLGLGLAIGLYYRIRTKNVMKIRNNSRKLEREFASALFQLGNRIGDGLPAEIAFERVAASMEGTISGNFFSMVSINIRKLGMGIKDAIFHPRVGALIYFPSNLIESSMKVLIESAKKGPRVASQALINVSQYIKEIHRVDERLKDLLSDTISSMKSQISFLAPCISAIVIGITSMITTILGRLGEQMQRLSASQGIAGSGAFMDLFGDGIPTFYFQIIVGVYVVQLVYILSILTTGIENGSDALAEKHSVGVNLVKSTTLYIITIC